jgi:hypothetical protein
VKSRFLDEFRFELHGSDAVDSASGDSLYRAVVQEKVAIQFPNLDQPAAFEIW